MAIETLNIGVIGLGVGLRHLEGYRKHPRTNVAAICDSDSRRLEQVAKQEGIVPERCFGDVRAMFKAAREMSLHAVSIAVPNYLHAPLAIAAFKQGLHVLCEKPMAMNVREAQQMVAAAKKAGKKLMINFTFRFNEQSQALKRLVSAGAIGQVYFGRTVWHRRRGMPGFGGWFGQLKTAGGGPVIDLGVHRLDLALWLMGNPRPVSVSGATYGHLGRQFAAEQGRTFDVEDLGCALVKFENGASLIVEASWAGFGEKRDDMATQLYGTKGGIVQRNIGEGYDFEARIFSEQHGTLWESRLQQSTTPSVSAYWQFVDAILEDQEVPAPGEHGLDVQLIIDAIYRSAKTGKEVIIRPTKARKA